MLFSTKELAGFDIAARDGHIGRVRELYFDDQRWTIRHLVVDTGAWLSGRRVLVSPHSVQSIYRSKREVAVSLTRRQVEDAPGVDTDQPVSRQHEISHYDYYGYPYYWTGFGLWGGADYPLDHIPPEGAASPELPEPAVARMDDSDPHLRSSAEVTGYHLEASDGSIGHIEDFLFEEGSWMIRHIVVDTRNWLPGRRVLIEPGSVESVDWAGREVQVTLTREAIKSSPPYEPGKIMT